MFSKFPMEFSGGPLDFTAIGLCVVKCPLIINITLQAHAGRFGIILLYIIVTTHCPSSTARAPLPELRIFLPIQFAQPSGPRIKYEALWAQPRGPTSSTKFPQLTLLSFFYCSLFLFFYLCRCGGEVKVPLPKQGGVGHELLTRASLCVVCFYGP